MFIQVTSKTTWTLSKQIIDVDSLQGNDVNKTAAKGSQKHAVQSFMWLLQGNDVDETAAKGCTERSQSAKEEGW